MIGSKRELRDEPRPLFLRREPTMRISRSTGVLCGLLLLVLGLWGGLIPFIGPYFDYSFGSNATWHYSVNRLWLDILPAVIVILGALIMLRADHRISGVFGSWMALIGGVWFVIGPAVSRVWEHGAGPIGAPLFGATRQMVELLGYFVGLGALIVALAAFALGRFVSRPAIALEPIPTSDEATAPSPRTSADSEPAAAPTAVPTAASTQQPAAAPAQPAMPAAAVDSAAPRRRRSLHLRPRRSGAPSPAGAPDDETSARR
jgi:hypothetical protein